MLTLDLDRYGSSMRALAALVTDAKSGGRRVVRKGSDEVPEINVVCGKVRTVVLLKEHDLYLRGFRNARGTAFVFAGEPGGTPLHFSGEYVRTAGTIGIFNGTEKNEERIRRKDTKENIAGAMYELSKFTGGNDLDLKLPLAMMALIVSEALRFTIVYDRIAAACRYPGREFSFAELRPYIQNWEDLSVGAGPAGLLKNSVYTSHS